MLQKVKQVLEELYCQEYPSTDSHALVFLVSSGVVFRLRTRVLRSNKRGEARSWPIRHGSRLYGGLLFLKEGFWKKKFLLAFCGRASATCVLYTKSAHFVVSCVESSLTTQRDGLIEGMVEEELGFELWCDDCALGGLILITNGNLGLSRELRVEVQFVSVLTFFAP